MALIRHVIFLVAMAVAAGVIFAQNGVSVQAEIETMEKTLGRQDITGARRHEALVRLARLRELSGDIEGAAKNWLEAAAAIPDRVDDDALLSCAWCLAAMGEWERVSAVITPILHKYPQARFLEAAVNAARTGDVSALSAIAADPSYFQMKSRIYFILWKISGADVWKQRLIFEFPQSPEGRLAAENGSLQLSVKPNMFWLYLAGRNTFSQMETQSFSQAAVPVMSAPVMVPAESIRLQAGLFSRQDYAKELAENLKKAGFFPLIEQRIVGGNELWVVTVPAGRDVNDSIGDLKAAGFDSFPLY
jgi:hypothetical protein